MREGDEPTALIRRADEALYAANAAAATPPSSTTAKPANASPSTDLDETGWHELCNDLRERLAAVLR